MPAPMNKAVVKRCLAAVPLFSELADPQLDLLATATRATVARKNARIFEEGAPADCCFVITSGKARVVLSADDGTETLLAMLAATSLVGEIALLDRSTRSAAVVAATDCHLLRIPVTAFDELRKNPAFEQKLVAHIAATLRDTNEHVRALSAFSCTARLAWCLARIARQEGEKSGSSLVIPRKPHHDLAQMTGCTRETVTRARGTLKRKKCVSWDDGTMRLDIEGLQRYVRSEIRLPSRLT
jgi:CRP/FNR family transcriptional regulator